jgi:hypothetical protein
MRTGSTARTRQRKNLKYAASALVGSAATGGGFPPTTGREFPAIKAAVARLARASRLDATEGVDDEADDRWFDADKSAESVVQSMASLASS